MFGPLCSILKKERHRWAGMLHERLKNGCRHWLQRLMHPLVLPFLKSSNPRRYGLWKHFGAWKYAVCDVLVPSNAVRGSLA